MGEQNLFIVFVIREKASSCQCLVGKFFLIFFVVLKNPVKFVAYETVEVKEINQECKFKCL